MPAYRDHLRAHVFKDGWHYYHGRKLVATEICEIFGKYAMKMLGKIKKIYQNLNYIWFNDEYLNKIPLISLNLTKSHKSLIKTM